MNIYLIGYRGSGKTTVARALAEKLGRPWFDADVELERRAGRTIKEIFAAEREPFFRDLEAATLADLAAVDGRIVALGGGVILRPANREVLARTGTTVWLKASPEALWARIAGDPTTAARRPDLTVGGGLAEVARLLAERTPLYAACANFTLETEGKSPEELAAEVVAVFDKIQTRPAGEGP